jgi:topoisomerase-4 subunit B
VTHYARDDAHREELLATVFSSRGKVEISRFKGLGEMPARYLRATTMDPAERTLLRVMVPPRADPAAIQTPESGQTPDLGFARTETLVETLMGRRPELRFDYIQKNARFARDLDV